MTITELREAFAAWRKAETGQAVLAYNLIWLLTDPTPITEAGLRELGFRFDPSQPLPVYRLGETMAAVDADGACGVSGKSANALVRGMGKLRLLLLGVVE